MARGDGQDPQGGGGVQEEVVEVVDQSEKPKGLGNFPSLGDLLDKLKDFPLLKLNSAGKKVNWCRGIFKEE